jgi:ferric-dicitrate binding protein FerR (iron transport regulator)
MTTEKAIQIAGMIAKGDVEPSILNSWLKFLETAPDAEMYHVLEAYNEALRSNPDLPQRVAPDLMKRLENLLPQEDIVRQKETPVRNIRWWIPATAAAVLIFVVSYFISQPGSHSNDTVKSIVQQPATDVKPPAANRAMIQLANGTSVYLDSTTKGQLALEDNVKLVKLDDGKIAYKGTTTETIYNTLYNPKGSRPVDMTLSDGSRVWLNAGSSVTYPVTFTGKERKVSIDGEAYFEVTHDEQKPFIVTKGEMETRVLGTHFNIKAYDEEDEIRVTLLEGSVSVTKNAAGSILKAGQQAQVKNGIKVNSDVDLEAVMAWKNGRFIFQGTGTEETLREIARWYDVELEFRGKPMEQHFGGDISRNVEASKVFEMLENTGALHVKIEGKKIIVLP